MAKKISILLVSLCTMIAAFGNEFNNESLTYKVMYKWGLINKKAGEVKIRLKSNEDKYDAKLTAASASWADRIYKVRDTLRCEMYKDGLVPVYYDKISHEGDDDKHDHVRYERQGNKVIGYCTRKQWNNGKLKRDEERTLEAEGTTVDMLTAYYYMRNLPYDQWQSGHEVSINIFSGKRKELLTIKYHGIETVEYDKRKYQCYYITFIFTSDGKTKTSDDMMAWITTTPDRIPVKLEGKLPVGSVKCFYTGE